MNNTLPNLSNQDKSSSIKIHPLPTRHTKHVQQAKTPIRLQNAWKRGRRRESGYFIITTSPVVAFASSPLLGIKSRAKQDKNNRKAGPKMPGSYSSRPGEEQHTRCKDLLTSIECCHAIHETETELPPGD